MEKTADTTTEKSSGVLPVDRPICTSSDDRKGELVLERSW
jgi:hypothetical protein